MLGTSVIVPSALVPQMGDGNEEKAGMNTLGLSLFGTRLRAVMGGSYTIVAPTISIIMAGRYNNVDPRELVQSSPIPMEDDDSISDGESINGDNDDDFDINSEDNNFASLYTGKL